MKNNAVILIVFLWVSGAILGHQASKYVSSSEKGVPEVRWGDTVVVLEGVHQGRQGIVLYAKEYSNGIHYNVQFDDAPRGVLKPASELFVLDRVMQRETFAAD